MVEDDWEINPIDHGVILKLHVTQCNLVPFGAFLQKGPDTVHFFKDKWLILLSLNDSVLRAYSL